MNSRTEVESNLWSLWRDSDEYRLAMRILDYVLEMPDAAHISYAEFLRLARELNIADIASVPRVLQYLTGAESHVLDLGAELITEDDEVHRLQPWQLEAAMKRSIHPLTGDVTPGVESDIFVYFLPSELARKMLTRR